MSDLKKQLVKLGTVNPDLRPHIRPILATLSKRAGTPSFRYVITRRDKVVAEGSAQSKVQVFAAVNKEMRLLGGTLDVKIWDLSDNLIHEEIYTRR